MPKVTLEFNLPEEQIEFELACSGSDLHCVLSETRNELRRILKHEPDKFEKGYDALEYIQKYILDELDSYAKSFFNDF